MAGNATGPRLPARANELLAASERAFAKRGYFGTSTAAVASEMGVSQPYVIDAFGSKMRLFIATHQFSGEKMVRTFAQALAEFGFDPPRVGGAYRDLVLTERDAVKVITHAFTASDEPEIGAEAHRLLAAITGLLAQHGATDDQITAFLSTGMLINTLVLLGPDGADPDLPAVFRVLQRAPGGAH